MLKKVRMLVDHGPWKEGQVVDVDPLRCARLVEGAVAELLLDDWNGDEAPPAAAPAPNPRPTRRRKRGGA